MPKIMLINVTHPEESRVAIIKDGVLEAFEIESSSREHLKGNIYKGIVHRIHPALEAAFVNIGSDRDAFLPLDEICFRNLPRQPPPRHNGGNSKNGRRRRRIRDLLRPGEELLVQITKEPHGNKPATLTTFYSLPGRYLVLLPGSDEAGISRRIEGDDRVRLRRLISELHAPDGFGLIVRTAAGFDENDAELKGDLSYLYRLWRNVEKVAERTPAPALVYREHDIVLRTIRDFFAPDIDEIYIDNEEIYERARQFLSELLPGREHVLRLYEGPRPIFSAFDVEAQFESIFKRRVPLPSGGSIVIDPTEALTAIDVNSGGSVRGANPEDTAFRTNLEAAAEVCRQMRLRDIGGLIVVDFIDMRDPTHIQEVERAVRDGMRLDRARYEVGRISRFGLMEISRQRLRPAAMATTYTTCAMCEGYGAVRTTESAALVALRKIHNRVAQGDVARLRVTLPNEVALYLLNQKRDALAQLEVRYDTRIQVSLSSHLMPHQMEMETASRALTGQTPAAVPPGTVAAPAEVEVAEEATSGEQEIAKAEPNAADGDNSKKRRRRRGRRRGRGGLKAAVAMGQILAELGDAAGWTARGTTVDNEGEEEVSAAEMRVAAEEKRELQEERAEKAEELMLPPEDRTQPAAADKVTLPPPKQPSRSRRRGGRRPSRRGPGEVVAEEPVPAAQTTAASENRRAVEAESVAARPAEAVAAAEPAPAAEVPATTEPPRRGRRTKAVTKGRGALGEAMAEGRSRARRVRASVAEDEKATRVKRPHRSKASETAATGGGVEATAKRSARRTRAPSRRKQGDGDAA